MTPAHVATSNEPAPPGAGKAHTSLRPLVRMVFGLEGSEQDRDGVRTLLHRRMRQVSSISALTIAALFVSMLLDLRVGVQRSLIEYFLVSAILLGTTATAVFLWRQRRLNLGLLRGIEMVWFSLGVAVPCLQAHHWLTAGVTTSQLIQPEFQELALVSPWIMFGNGSLYIHRAYQLLDSPLIINFGALAVVYGVFIPNTWQRCLGVLLGILIVPEACIIQAVLTIPALRPHLLLMMWHVFYLVGFCVAIGVYGCHKLTALRRAESEVRAVGQYRLGERLGRGGMGEVYLARHRMLRRPCAVKLIRADQAVSAQLLARFEREVQAMAALTHPNTVEIYDYGRTEDGTLYYAMEYLPGLTLDALVRTHGPLPPGRAVYLLRQMCRALAEAHAAGLIHRDIKPGNIFVTERGGERDFIKLLDFGLVHVRGAAIAPLEASEAAFPAGISAGSLAPIGDDSSFTKAGSILGTPAYMAPEQIEGTPEPRSDIYSVGIVAYFALTGTVPFVRTTVASMLLAQLRDAPPSLHGSEIPADLEAVVLRCLAKLPAERYTDASELESALAACACSASWDAATATAWWRRIEGKAAAPHPEESHVTPNWVPALPARQD